MFKLGDKVGWQSQANGSWKKKEGVIIEVVPDGIRPSLYRPNGGDMGYGRNHESYVVRVGKSRTYWPLVSKLKKIK